MANEISLTASLTATKNNASATVSKTGLAVTMTGTNMLHKVASIGTSEEALDLGDCGTGGWFMAKNLDDTNFVSIRQGTGASDLIRLRAGEVCLFRLDADATAPYIIADTASVDVEYLLLED